MNKKKNAGFSLVELIVVVLIMAIVAVALAPQVMKWVENSRVSSDIQTMKDIENICRLALTDEEAFAMVKDGGYEILISKGPGGAISYDYLPAGTDFDTDPFWQNFLKVGGFADKNAFEGAVTVKSNATEGDTAVMHIYVYVGGYTFSKLENVVNEQLDLT